MPAYTRYSTNADSFLILLNPMTSLDHEIACDHLEAWNPASDRSGFSLSLSNKSLGPDLALGGCLIPTGGSHHPDFCSHISHALQVSPESHYSCYVAWQHDTHILELPPTRCWNWLSSFPCLGLHSPFCEIRVLG